MSSSSTFSTFLTKAVDFVSGQLEVAKESLGFESQFPQSSISHSNAYLNDIARGSYTLKNIPSSSISISYYPVVGIPQDWNQWKFNVSTYRFKTRSARYPFLDQLRQKNGNFSYLKPSRKQMRDGSQFSWHGPYEMRRSVDRPRLLEEISTFDRSSKLRMTSYQKPYYLTEIESGSWKQNLNHVTSIRETSYPIVGFQSSLSNPWRLGQDTQFNLKFNRRAFLDQLNSSNRTNLNHVQTSERGGLGVIGQGYKWNQQPILQNRQQLLQQISQFDRSGLNSIAPSLIQQAKDFVQDNLSKVQSALGFSSSTFEGGPAYLQDIQNGNWNLKKLGQSPKISYTPVVALPAGWGWFNSSRSGSNSSGFTLRKTRDLKPMWSELSSGKLSLKHVDQISDKSSWRSWGDKWSSGYQMKPKMNRSGFLQEIRSFDRSRLSSSYSDRRFMRDLTRGYTDSNKNRKIQQQTQISQTGTEAPRKDLMKEIRGFEPTNLSQTSYVGSS